MTRSDWTRKASSEQNAIGRGNHKKQEPIGRGNQIVRRTIVIGHRCITWLVSVLQIPNQPGNRQPDVCHEVGRGNITAAVIAVASLGRAQARTHQTNSQTNSQTSRSQAHAPPTKHADLRHARTLAPNKQKTNRSQARTPSTVAWQRRPASCPAREALAQRERKSHRPPSSRSHSARRVG
jgi:hypothetical protein